MAYELEHMHEVWNNETGDRYEIGPDRDGLNLVEIRSKDREGKIDARVSMDANAAKLIAVALLDQTFEPAWREALTVAILGSLALQDTSMNRAAVRGVLAQWIK